MFSSSSRRLFDLSMASRIICFCFSKLIPIASHPCSDILSIDPDCKIAIHIVWDDTSFCTVGKVAVEALVQIGNIALIHALPHLEALHVISDKGCYLLIAHSHHDIAHNSGRVNGNASFGIYKTLSWMRILAPLRSSDFLARLFYEFFVSYC